MKSLCNKSLFNIQESILAENCEKEFEYLKQNINANIIKKLFWHWYHQSHTFNLNEDLIYKEFKISNIYKLLNLMNIGYLSNYSEYAKIMGMTQGKYGFRIILILYKYEFNKKTNFSIVSFSAKTFSQIINKNDILL